jgi:hypothetical protein
MKRLVAVTCLVILVAACREPEARVDKAAHAQKGAATVPQYNLQVTFDGLMAFVQTSSTSMWALLVEANYDPTDPTKVKDSEVPPCAKAQGTASLVMDFPPHVAALRIKDADVLLNNVSVGGILPLFFIDGMDITFDTGLKNPSIDLSTTPLVTRATFGATLGQPAGNFKQHDTVHSKFLSASFPSGQWPDHLAARVLIDFGQQVATVACPMRSYGMQTPAQAVCQGTGTSLAEEVSVSQKGLTTPITIVLDASHTLTVQPKNGGNSLHVEVLNILPSSLVYSKGCDDPDLHPNAFRWYYYLAKDLPPPIDCSTHYFPCDKASSGAGGTKCPEMQMQPPPVGNKK